MSFLFSNDFLVSSRGNYNFLDRAKISGKLQKKIEKKKKYVLYAVIANLL